LFYAEIDPRVEVHKGVVAPEALLNFAAGNDLSRAFEQKQENSEGLRVDFQREPGLAQLAGFGVQLEFAEANHHRRPSGRGHESSRGDDRGGLYHPINRD